MSARIDFRDHMVSLIQSMSDFTASNTHLYKLDRVDATPAACVYLASMLSEKESMSGTSMSMARTLTVHVDFHSNHATDADSQVDTWLNELELLLYRSIKNNTAPASILKAQLDEAEYRPTERGGKKIGDLVSSWVAEFSETLTAS